MALPESKPQQGQPPYSCQLDYPVELAGWVVILLFEPWLGPRRSKSGPKDTRVNGINIA